LIFFLYKPEEIFLPKRRNLKSKLTLKEKKNSIKAIHCGKIKLFNKAWNWLSPSSQILIFLKNYLH